MSHIKLTGYDHEMWPLDAKDLNSSSMDMDQDDRDDVRDDESMVDSIPDQYCFLCANGGELVICSKCSRAICVGEKSEDTRCLISPATSDSYQAKDILFLCPPCHQEGDRNNREPKPYYGFYAFPGPGGHPTNLDTILKLKPAYGSPAKIRGSAQLLPRSKFLSNGIAVLNFRLKGFNEDTGDFGKVLEPFARAFFPKANKDLVVFEHITYDLDQDKNKHKRVVDKVAKRLKKASKTLKTVIILVTTHASKDTGKLGTSSTHYLSMNEWIAQVITKKIMDVLRVLNTHWFFFCCGALVTSPPSLELVKSCADELKPVNLFAFDAPAFHPIYAATFLLNFFHHIIIGGMTFSSAVGLLLNTSPLSRHTGIKRFWTVGSVVKNCTLKWAHSRIQPSGHSVPYQCPRCSCIQAWNQKGQGASTDIGRDVTMQCSYREERGQCPAYLAIAKPSVPYKSIKLPEGVWVAFGLPKSESL